VFSDAPRTLKNTLARLFVNAAGYPLVIFYVSAMVFHQAFSLQEVVIGVLAFASNWLLIYSWMAKYHRDSLREIAHFLRQFSACSFRRIPLDSAVPPNILHDFLWQNLVAMSPKKARRMEAEIIRRVLIYIVDTHDSPVTSSSLTTFILPIARMYVFTADNPSDLSGTGKFHFYHELGHLSVVSSYLAYRRIISARLWFLWVWAGIQISATTANMIFILLLGIAIICRDVIGIPLGWHEDGLHEAFADYFGLRSLDDKERLQVVRFYRSRPNLPHDPSLVDTVNKERRSNLTHMLEQIEITDGRDVPAPPFPLPRLFPALSGFLATVSLGYVIRLDIVTLVLAACLTVGLAAYFLHIVMGASKADRAVSQLLEP
jgi:hypothetical protein